MYSKLTKVAEFSTWNHCVCTDLHYTHIHIQEGLPELIFTEGCDEDGVDLGPCISLQRCSNGRLSTNGSAAGGVDAVRVMLLGVTDAGRSPF